MSQLLHKTPALMLTYVSGDETANQKFVAVAEAYDILSVEETRKIYDQYGQDGIEQHKKGNGPGQRHDPFDLFSRFFGGSGHFGHHGGERRGPNMEVRVAVPLRDFYNGRKTEFTIEKQAICSACEGSGSADGDARSPCRTAAEPAFPLRHCPSRRIPLGHVRIFSTCSW